MKRYTSAILAAIFAFLLLNSLVSLAQSKPAFAPDKMETVLYGAAYYTEYMPYDRLDRDVQLMQQAGISVVRMGESSWGLWEPQDGRFEYAWMDRVIDRMQKAGIKVILGTPTYSVPAWMYKEHPEIFITRFGGQTITFGLRQNTDLMNPVYRSYCERVIRKLLEHYKDNPAVIGWQIDNETSSGGAANPDVQAGFVKYLQNKFQTVDELNKVWGLNYWGQRLNDWSEIPPQAGIINPGWKLEWERYQQWMTTDFLAWQSRIVNEYKRPDQFITHDLAGPPRSEVNEHDIARSMDIMAVNPYHGTQDQFDGLDSSHAGDYTRSLKGTNYLVTETNAQTIGWDSKEQYPPYDGQLRLDVYTHLSSGANMVEYWHWHSIQYGQETYWKGVLSHDLEPNRAYAEVSRTAHELERIGAHLAGLKVHNEVAILWSRDSANAISFMPFGGGVPARSWTGEPDGYLSLVQQLHKSLYELNIGSDFVFPETQDFSNYKLLIVPALYISDDALLQRISDYVKNGGHVVMTFKSGFANENSAVRWVRAPGPLREAAGFSYQEFSNL